MIKRSFLLSAFAVILAFLLPLLLSVRPNQRVQPAEPTPSPSPLPDEPERAPVLDAAIMLSVKTEGGVREMSMAEYLPGALAGEMPAAFDSEALKAQTVALRSYALHYQSARKQTHPDADVCTSPSCCAAWTAETDMQALWGSNFGFYSSKLHAACTATDGQYLVYEDAPILAVFHASSVGQTETGADLGTVQPYLQSVSTPETADAVTNLCTTVEVSAADFQQTLRSASPTISLDGSPDTWLGKTSLNEAGRVQSVTIGGQEVSGLALRAMFSLRSTDFTLTRDGDLFVFHVNGYGHGLGMSQHGANLMAKSGSDYAEILAHYYPGTQLVIAMVAD